MMRLGLLASAPAAAGAGAAHGQMGCWEPSKPYCLSLNADESCRSSVQSYLRQEAEYRDCLARAVQRALQESHDRAADAVRQWNCRAAGNAVCF